MGQKMKFKYQKLEKTEKKPIQLTPNGCSSLSFAEPKLELEFSDPPWLYLSENVQKMACLNTEKTSKMAKTSKKSCKTLNQTTLEYEIFFQTQYFGILAADYDCWSQCEHFDMPHDALCRYLIFTFWLSGHFHIFSLELLYLELGKIFL